MVDISLGNRSGSDSLFQDGKLTSVQPIGANPRKFDSNATEIYGVGAFLLAGREMHKLAEM